MRLVRAVARAAAERADDDVAFEWIARLQQLHRDDVGVLAPLFLHAVRLEPGEAIFLPARELHAYLQGVGVELMASSDNVLRGGLTSKPLAVDELLRILRFEPARPGAPARAAGRVGLGALPRLPRSSSSSRARSCAAGRRSRARRERGVEILLCTEGEVELVPADAHPRVRLAQGASCIVPAAAGAYRASGRGTLYRASVPL